MKMSIVVGILLIAGVFLFIKLNNKDNAARKEAIEVEARVEKLRCEQRLKGDKSLIKLSYNNQTYSIFTTEKKCHRYKEGSTTKAYYSPSYDKLFLEL